MTRHCLCKFRPPFDRFQVPTYIPRLSFKGFVMSPCRSIILPISIIPVVAGLEMIGNDHRERL